MESGAAGRLRQLLRFQAVDEPILELKMPTDMVCVRMGRDRYDRFFEQMSRRLAQTADPHARIDQHVTVAPRTCQMLQRRSGTTCGSHSSVMSSSIRRISNQCSAIAKGKKQLRPVAVG